MFDLVASHHHQTAVQNYVDILASPLPDILHIVIPDWRSHSDMVGNIHADSDTPGKILLLVDFVVTPSGKTQ